MTADLVSHFKFSISSNKHSLCIMDGSRGLLIVVLCLLICCTAITIKLLVTIIEKRVTVEQNEVFEDNELEPQQGHGSFDKAHASAQHMTGTAQFSTDFVCKSVTFHDFRTEQGLSMNSPELPEWFQQFQESKTEITNDPQQTVKEHKANSVLDRLEEVAEIKKRDEQIETLKEQLESAQKMNVRLSSTFDDFSKEVKEELNELKGESEKILEADQKKKEGKTVQKDSNKKENNEREKMKGEDIPKKSDKTQRDQTEEIKVPELDDVTTVEIGHEARQLQRKIEKLQCIAGNDRVQVRCLGKKGEKTKIFVDVLQA